MCKTIKQKVKFKAPPAAVYRLLTDSKQHSAFTKHKAQISRKVGGYFSTCAGHISGVNVDLSPGKRVVQAWRTKRFPEGIFSMAAFVLTRAKDGGTELTLTHRGVPKDLIPEIEALWKKRYWRRMRDYLAGAVNCH